MRNKKIYLERMARPLQEKLRIARYIPAHAKNVLDVGCADGTITLSLAKLFPKIHFLGIDLEEDFIQEAQDKAEKAKVENIEFEKIYLRDLLARSGRFDAVSFVSVLHEFYSYGEGTSSVLKALADAHELLRKGGEIVIRDMILDEYTKRTTFQVEGIVKKISAKKGMKKYIKDFENRFGRLENINTLNHFLLKYMYKENWDREVREHYVPLTFTQYEQLFALLGMDLQLKDSYLIDYLRNKWKKDFGLTEDEMAGLRSTGFLVARKL